MSKFDSDEVEAKWIKTKDDLGRTKYIHPNIVRPGGRRLAVFASDLRGDDGKLVLMGKYLVALPDIEIKDGELEDVKRVWVTKHQAKRLLKLIGQDYRKILRQNFGHMLIGFLAKAGEGLLKVSGAVLTPVQKLVFDTAFQHLSDDAYERVKDAGDVKAELLALEIKKLTKRLADEVNPMLREVLGEDFDATNFVDAAVNPVVKQLEELFD